jgi:hypothetical protein
MRLDLKLYLFLATNIKNKQINMDIYILTDQKHMMVLDWSSKATFGI